MASIPDPPRLAAIKARRAERYDADQPTLRDWADIDWLVAELDAALKAFDLIKKDGHTHPEEGNCLTCEAVAEFDAQHG